MTIKIEREAVLYILDGESSSQPQSPPLPDPESHDEEAEIVVYRPKEEAAVTAPSTAPCLFRPPTCDDFFSSTPDLVDSDVESDVSSDIGDAYSTRGVTFAFPLVTEVRSRPRTPRHDLRSLFYTHEETQEFRREYRRERELLAQLEAEAEALSREAPSSPPQEKSSRPASPTSWSPAKRARRISRVVIQHEDTFETFFNDNSLLKKESPSLPAPTIMDTSDDFFDNDSFWSGSITWY
uniref:Uncharacterized protein n=1 Tax=Trieres chinensis TaxID=1514140 RepID=A0A7S1ZAS3_TRICV|mmetsp:Transcript_21204/g.42799  ORF Transcript_21204/g.42799 Transcript_21204/m.42799 type:complete len:238 (+) Transcript_21204:51-764(+)